jgi:threonine dehydratase
MAPTTSSTATEHDARSPDLVGDKETVITQALSADDVVRAAGALAGRVERTPVLHSDDLDEIIGARVWVKAENLQRGGSYKLRGATYAVSRLADRGARGVLAQSTGNHGIAVALAARVHGLDATIVLPTVAPSLKQEAIERFGARLVLEPGTTEDRILRVRRLRSETGHDIVDAYDHPDVIAGQGTATLEMLEDLDGRGVRPDAVVLPVGGGGGLAGACLATERRGAAVHGVEPVGCDSMTRSLEAGRRVTVAPTTTLADGLTPSRVGALPFEIARRAVASMVLVDDAQLRWGLHMAARHLRLLVEPSAAAGLAAACELARRGCTDIGVMLTGGNVPTALVADVLAGEALHPGAGRGSVRCR